MCPECGGQAFCRNRNAGPHHSQSTRAYTGFRSGSALFTSSACSCTWYQMVAAPVYLLDMMTSVADLPVWERMRSSSSFWYEPRWLKLKFGERIFNSGSSYRKLRTEGMEFSSVQSPGTHKHWNLQKTVESSHSENFTIRPMPPGSGRILRMTADCKCEVDDLAWTTVGEGGRGLGLLAPSAFLPSSTATVWPSSAWCGSSWFWLWPHHGSLNKQTWHPYFCRWGPGSPEIVGQGIILWYFILYVIHKYVFIKK